MQELCIYVTGSFGRLEASQYSDLDLFFIHPGNPGTPISTSYPGLPRRYSMLISLAPRDR